MTGLTFAPVRRTCVFAAALILLLAFSRSGAAMQWAKGQVRMLLLTQGWLGLLPLAGIWLAAVAFFGAQRRCLADHLQAPSP